MTTLSLNYERVERQLASADIEIGGAEVHGVLCGLLCAGAVDAKASWFTELFSVETAGDLLVQECHDTLSIMFQETQEAINDPGLGFSPFLPDDEQLLKLRAEAVSEWCQGFLYGTGLANLSPQLQLSTETQEALQSLSEITRLDLDTLEGDESDDEALIEITEFIWVAAMLVHSELAPDATERS